MFKTPLDVLLWNIGYCGLGEHSDFFYDGGRMFVRILTIMIAIGMGCTVISQSIVTTLDFMLLQEVDRDSRRSYNHDQYEGLGIMFDGWEAAHALNYKNLEPNAINRNAIG